VKQNDKHIVVVIHKDYKATSHASVTIEPFGTDPSGTADLLVLKGKDGILSRFGLSVAGQTFDGASLFPSIFFSLTSLFFRNPRW